MNKILLFIAVVTFGAITTYAQSQKIIEENFQLWVPTEGTDTVDCESFPHEIENFRSMELTTSGGTLPIEVTLIKCAISPDCNTKRVNRGDATENTEGVTTGFVSLSKAPEPTDTIGEFIFGPIPQIDSIQFSHSATGSNRGIRIYTSSDREHPGDNILVTALCGFGAGVICSTQITV